MAFTFDVQEIQKVNEWKDKAEDLNSRAEQAVRAAASTLQEFNSSAEGQIIDDISEFGEGVIVGLTDIVQGMGKLISAVGDFVDRLRAHIEEMRSQAKDVRSQTLGS